MPRESTRSSSATLTPLLAGLAAITPLSIDMPLPALPQLTRVLGTDVAHAQLVVSAFLLGFAVAQLVHGPLSDRLGRRPVLLGAMVLYTVAGLVCARTTSIDWLLAARLVQGVAACAGPVVARAVVRDLHEGPRAARTMSLMATGMSAAPIAAPIIGGLLLTVFDWPAIFLTLAGSGAVLLLLIWGMLGETNTRRDPRAVEPRRLAANYLTILANRTFAGYVLTVACGSIGLFAFISGSSFVLIDLLGVSPRAFGFCFATVMIGQVSGAALSSILVPRLGIDRTMRAGLVFYLLGGLSMTALAWLGVARVAAVVAPMAVFMLGNGMLMPSGMAGAIGPFPRMAGSASAMLGFIQMATGALAGALIGRLLGGTPIPMATTIAAAAVIAAVTFRLLVWKPAGSPWR